MHYVYIIRSIPKPAELYKGHTANLIKRMKYHNSGNSKHTAKHKPWKLIFYAAFETKEKVLEFEKYLKTASGIAFMRKRLIS